MCNNILQIRIGLFDGSINKITVYDGNKIERMKKYTEVVFFYDFSGFRFSWVSFLFQDAD